MQMKTADTEMNKRMKTMHKPSVKQHNKASLLRVSSCVSVIVTETV